MGKIKVSARPSAAEDKKYELTKDEIARLGEHKRFKEDKEREERLKQGSWQSQNSGQSYGLGAFLKFALPFMWKGGIGVKLTTIMLFVLMIVSRLGSIAHPLILKAILDNVTCKSEGASATCPDIQATYLLIVLYAVVKFLADFINYIREVPFAYVSANSEKHIAKLVYGHI